MDSRLEDSSATKYYDILPNYEKWSGDRIPSVGDKVDINFNRLGSGTVDCYFIEYGYLGVVVVLENQPKWHKEQNDHNLALVFGNEII